MGIMLPSAERARILPKTSPVIRQIYDWVCSEYDNGRITVITDEELMSHYHACAD